jgi:hypothetical protein
LRKEEAYQKVLPWDATAILQKRTLPADQAKGQHVGPLQLANAHTGASTAYQGASIHASTENLDRFSITQWSTHVVAPEQMTTPFDNLISGPGAGAPPALSFDEFASTPAFWFTPGHTEGSISTGGEVLTPMQFGGEPLHQETSAVLTAMPAVADFGNGQQEFLSPGLDAALPAFSGEIGDFGTEWLFNDEYDFNFNDFTMFPELEPEAADVHEPQQGHDEKGNDTRLGKRRFSQV